jgi:lipopolysaccharide assembly protein B
MVDWQLYIALVFALAIGFFLGYRAKTKKVGGSAHLSLVDDHYFKGLNFLLNEQPDAAIDTFIRALEVNSETLETHLALGKLLRKRGEVDRAIRIHQNLLARPGLSLHHIQQAQYELATDFVKSGLFDRAEGLLTELVRKEGAYKIAGLKRLLEVYRDEKEWLQGLDVLQKLAGSRLSRSYEEWATVRAHFCCELAEMAVEDRDDNTARHWLKQASSYDKQSVRAGLLMGQVELASGYIDKAITQLQKVAVQHSDYISEVLPYLTDAYSRLDKTAEYQQFLYSLFSDCHDEAILLVLSDVIARQKGELVAAQYVADEVVKYPSVKGLYKLLEYYISFSEGKTQGYLVSLRSVMDNVISNTLYYQCRHCGFKGKRLHWLCPSCKTWGSVKPKKATEE